MLPAEALATGPWLLLPMVFLQNLLVGSAMGEELGWRGFALPPLLARHGALPASGILGLPWGVWHVPLFLTVGHPLAHTPFGWFLVNIVGEAVLYTWLLLRTRGSLLLVLLLHAATATTTLFLAATDEAPLVGAGLTWSLVVGVLLWGGLPAGARRAPELPEAPALLS